ncbi:MAG: hypothetical protein ACP5JP_08145 [bacterium]
MSTTTVGKALIGKIFEDYKGEEMDRKTLKQYFMNKAKQGKEHYINAIHNVKTIGDQISTLHGMSVGLDDLKPIEHKIGDNDPFAEQSKAYKVAEQHPGALSEMVKSGARGSGNHLSAILTTPVFAVKHDGTLLPVKIKNNYAKGLKNHEYYSLAFQTRNEVVESSTGVVEPGDVGKMLVANMHDAQITMEDCGTSNGILMSMDDPHILDRFLAKDHPPYKRNTLLTPEIVRDLSRKYKKVIVRSPLTCQAKDGICRKCWGLLNSGNLPDIGMNIGFRAANVLSEPLVQFTLNARHGARFGSTQVSLSGLKGIRQMLEFPPNFINKAELALDNETIKEVKKLPTGAYEVITDKNRYLVSAGLKPLPVGTKLKKGDAISSGIPYPPDLVRLKGLGEGRLYAVQQLHNVYKEAGHDIDKRYFELLAKNHYNYAKVWNKSLSHSIIPGETTQINKIQEALQKDSTNKHIENVKEGDILAEPILHHVAGTRLTKDMIDEIKKMGYKSILIYNHPNLNIEFVIKPIEQSPLLHPDTLAKLSYRYLKQSILEAPAFATQSRIKGPSPIPTYMVGEPLQ